MMQSQDGGSSSLSSGSSGSAAGGAAALPPPKHELLYHETKWIVLKLLSCAPSAAESPSATSMSSSRHFSTGRGNVSPRTLQTGVNLRLAGTIGDGAAACYDLETDADTDGEPAPDVHDGPTSSFGQRRFHRASLTLDVRPASGVDTLQQVMEEEVCVELNRLTEEMRDSNVDIYSSPILTPQTEAANVLRALGDRMNESFSGQLEIIADDVVDMSKGGNASSDSPLAYEAFELGARQLIGEGSSSVSTGWNSVALVLAYGQRVAWNLLKKGHKSLGDVADFTTRVLWDHAAGFIVHEGGWSAMSPVPSMTSYLSDGSAAPVSATVDTVDSTMSSQPVASVRGTTINQVDGYIRLARDQGSPDCDRLPRGPAAAHTTPVTAGRGQGAETVKSSSQEDDRSLLCGAESSQCSSAAATVSSEMSIPIFSRSCSMEETPTSGTSAAQSAAAFGSDSFLAHDENAEAMAAAADGRRASHDQLVFQYTNMLQEAHSAESLSEHSGVSWTPHHVIENERPTLGTSLSTSLPLLAPSPFGSVRDIRLSLNDGDGDSDAGSRWLTELSPSAFGSMRDLRGCGVSAGLDAASTKHASPATVRDHDEKLDAGSVSIASAARKLPFTLPEPGPTVRARSVPTSPAAGLSNVAVRAIPPFDSCGSPRKHETASITQFAGQQPMSLGDRSHNTTTGCNLRNCSRPALSFESMSSATVPRLSRSDATSLINVNATCEPSGPGGLRDVVIKSGSVVEVRSTTVRRSMDVLMRTDLPRKPLRQLACPVASVPSTAISSQSALSRELSNELLLPQLSSVQQNSKPTQQQVIGPVSNCNGVTASLRSEPLLAISARTDEPLSGVSAQLAAARDTGCLAGAANAETRQRVPTVLDDCASTLQLLAPVISCDQIESEGKEGGTSHFGERVRIVDLAAFGHFECACGCPSIAAPTSSDHSGEGWSSFPLHTSYSVVSSGASAGITAGCSAGIANMHTTSGGNSDNIKSLRCVKWNIEDGSTDRCQSSPATYRQRLLPASAVPDSGWSDEQSHPLCHRRVHCCTAYRKQPVDTDCHNGAALREGDAIIGCIESTDCQASPALQSNNSALVAATLPVVALGPAGFGLSNASAADTGTAGELVVASMGATEHATAGALEEAAASCSEGGVKTEPPQSPLTAYDTNPSVEPILATVSQGLLHSDTELRTVESVPERSAESPSECSIGSAATRRSVELAPERSVESVYERVFKKSEGVPESQASETSTASELTKRAVESCASLHLVTPPECHRSFEAQASERLLLGLPLLTAIGRTPCAASTDAAVNGRQTPVSRSGAASRSRSPLDTELTQGHALHDTRPPFSLAREASADLADGTCRPTTTSTVPARTKVPDNSGRCGISATSELPPPPLDTTTVMQQQPPQQLSSSRWPAVIGGLVLVVAVVFVAVRSRSQLLKGHPS